MPWCPAGATIADVRRCVHRGVALGVAILALTSSLPLAAAGASGTPPIRVHVTLDARHVIAGDPIEGTVELTNTTHKDIIVKTCAANGWLAVGLSGQVDSLPFGSFLVGCRSTIRLTPGANRFPVTVITTYTGCTQPQPTGTPATLMPVCVIADGHLSQPPLPAGRYSTKLHVVGLGGLTRIPNRVVVTLAAPAKAPCSPHAPKPRPRRSGR